MSPCVCPGTTEHKMTHDTGMGTGMGNTGYTTGGTGTGAGGGGMVENIKEKIPGQQNPLEASSKCHEAAVLYVYHQANICESIRNYGRSICIADQEPPSTK